MTKSALRMRKPPMAMQAPQLKNWMACENPNTRPL